MAPQEGASQFLVLVCFSDSVTGSEHPWVEVRLGRNVRVGMSQFLNGVGLIIKAQLWGLSDDRLLFSCTVYNSLEYKVVATDDVLWMTTSPEWSGSETGLFTAADKNFLFLHI